ncbi:cobalt-precorrin 5A hydrolase [Paraclostridium sordellii]|uniref:cobalt-precorrin 5A hydrolase n=2 Tax=Paraclostridium sordellii TaxID=1505 RepID=UPI0022E5F498|nr:cobalt-precorrin 5A hydrolase [Paeniclostridium sordellii]
MTRTLSMSTENKIAFISVTKNGKELAFKIKELLNEGDIFITEKLFNESLDNEKCKVINGRLGNLTKDLMEKYEVLIFIMATGIVVRSIASHIKNKFEDPAILVIDEKGLNVISLLSGHIGGANEMTNYISSLIGANPVITTATDVNGKSSLDMIAKRLNAYIDNFRENVKDVNYSLVNNKDLGIYIDGNYRVDTRGFITIKNINEFHRLNNLDKIIYITNKNVTDINDSRIIKVIPRDIVIGIGCRRNTPYEEIQKALDDLLYKYNIDKKSILKIGSVEVKKDEIGIIELARTLNVDFEIISLEEIKKVEDKFEKSEFVKKSIGVYSVAEPVAYLLSNKNLIVKKHKYKGITFSIGRLDI